MAGLFGGGGGGSPWRKLAATLLVREDAAAKAVASPKIAGFDLNDTLVSSRIGAPGYQVTVADWMLYSGTVVPKLRELHDAGFKLVIFTNQGNIRTALEGKRALAVKAYIDAFLKEVKVPMLVLAATFRDDFRKPSAGMWREMEKLNGGVAVDKAASLYVGDAAGGPGEHSADDVGFAKVVGVRFVHANDFFGPQGAAFGAAASAGAAAPPSARTVAGASKLAFSVERGLALRLPARPSPPVVLVLVGAPGCGKSTFADRLGPPAAAGARAKPRASGGGAAGREDSPWRRICQDLLGNKDACLRALAASLQAGCSVVIDRTNYSREQRAPWLDAAKASGAQCHCLVFEVALQDCLGRVAGRTDHEGNLQGGGSRLVVGKLFGQLEAVSTAEPFDRVRIVRTFADVDEETHFYRGGGAGTVEGPPAGPSEPPAKRQHSEAAGAPSAAIVAAVPTAATAPALPAAFAARAPRTVAAALAAAAAGAPAAVAATGPVAPAEEKPSPRRSPRLVAVADAKAAEEKVRMLAELGFPTGACRAALAAAGGDAQAAANRLLSDRLCGD